MNNPLPTGTVTFMFTDIEGSTDLLKRLGPAYSDLLVRQRAIIQEEAAANGGMVHETEGDGTFLVFPDAAGAVSAGVAIQVRLASEDWPHGDHVKVRIGIHTGHADLVGRDYVGMAVHGAARIAAAANGGQVLLSDATKGLLGTSPNAITMRDLGPHRFKDLGQPVVLHQVLHPDLNDDPRLPRTLEAKPNNLPAQLTSFVGRERELADIATLLRTARLVTVMGPGGSGKTRVALQAAADMLDGFRQGVWFIDLSTTSPSDPISLAVEVALGISKGAHEEIRGGRSREPAMSTTVIDHLRTASALLVVDNCEHLVAPVADFIGTTLKECPGLRFLATSREPLGVPGEARWRLPPLSLPDPEVAVGQEELSRFEAIQLFIDRARLNQPAFDLDETNASAIADICLKLDGIPLAIELAAAWVSMLSPQQIVQRLGDQSKFLAARLGHGMERQQTIRASINWSYDHLSEPEKRLFEDLSVFQSSFTLEAAEAVCGSGDSFEFLENMTHLVDKSLVVREGDSHPRYRMLQTIRRYATERLAEEAGPTTQAASSDPSGLNAVLRAEGDVYQVGFGDKVFTLKALRGLRYLQVLISTPEREHLALDLASGGGPSFMQAGLPALDDQAKRDYRRRLDDLRSEREDAEALGDQEKVLKIEGEIEAIASDLLRSVGLGGRTRQSGSPADKARMSVSKAIRVAIERIGDRSAEMARYLEATVKTGTYCVYRPDPGRAVRWDIGEVT